MILAILTAADLAPIKAEPDPAKRAAKAFDFAFQQLADARTAAAASQFDQVRTIVPTIADGVELAEESLTSRKKNAGRLKKGEQKCNDLLRRLETFKLDLPVDERAAVEDAANRIHSVQEHLLSLVMGRAK